MSSRRFAVALLSFVLVHSAVAFYIPQSMRTRIADYDSIVTVRPAGLALSTDGPINWLFSAFNKQKRNEYNRNCFFSPMNCLFTYADAEAPTDERSSELQDVKVILLDNPDNAHPMERPAKPKCPRPALGFIRRRAC